MYTRNPAASTLSIENVPMKETNQVSWMLRLEQINIKSMKKKQKFFLNLKFKVFLLLPEALVLKQKRYSLFYLLKSAKGTIVEELNTFVWMGVKYHFIST